MLHVISARCVARDLHMTASGPLERTCWIQSTAQRGDCQKSRFPPLNAIIIIIIITIVVVVIIIIFQTSSTVKTEAFARPPYQLVRTDTAVPESGGNIT